MTGAPDSKTKKPRTIGDESARRLETISQKPRGWMDHSHNSLPAAAPTSPDLAELLADAVATMPEVRWRSVRAQLDALAGHREMRDDVLPELRALLSIPAEKRQALG